MLPGVGDGLEQWRPLGFCSSCIYLPISGIPNLYMDFLSHEVLDLNSGMLTPQEGCPKKPLTSPVDAKARGILFLFVQPGSSSRWGREAPTSYCRLLLKAKTPHIQGGGYSGLFVKCRDWLILRVFTMTGYVKGGTGSCWVRRRTGKHLQAVGKHLTF